LIDVVENDGETKVVTEFLEEADYFKTKIIEVKFTPLFYKENGFNQK
jgi:hypothetical protein